MIEMMDYTDRWPAEFQEMAARLRQALGDLAVRIDHIGSTSVPGLAAKDILDIQVSVHSLEPFQPIEHALKAAGYAQWPGIVRDHRPPNATGPDQDWEKRYFKPVMEQRRVNLHVRVLGRANQRYALLFRDYLRAHPQSAAAYAEVKRRLAQYHPDDIDAYVEIKDPVCDIIASAAEDWAATTGWEMGATDA